MNLQETFEKVIAHLVTQGHPALELGACMFRAQNGDKCALGCLIPDNVYHPKMEGGFYYATKHLPQEMLDDWFPNASFLKSLQKFHDNDSNWKSKKVFIEKIQNIAIIYSLNTSFLDNLDWSNFGK